MLPDFPYLKDIVSEKINFIIRSIVKQDPLFSQIREEKLHEGNKSIIIIEDQEQEMENFDFKDQIEIKTDEIIEKGVDVFLQNIPLIAKKFIDDKHKMFLKSFERAADQSGNVVSSEGKPLNFDSYFKLLEKIEIQFNPEGKPIMPSIIINPMDIPQFEAMKKDLDSDPEKLKKIDVLIEQKRKEWHVRESNRKLVD